MTTEAEAIAKLVRAEAKGEIIEINGPEGAVQVNRRALPGGGDVLESVKKLADEYLERPERREGVARMHTLASFSAHVNRFKDDQSALFADRNDGTPRLLAVLDYHTANDENGEGHARFGRHLSAYAFPLSDEWKAWQDSNDGEWSQEDFAEFLEDRVQDVADPAEGVGERAGEFSRLVGCQFATPSRLLELSRGISVKVNASIKQVVRLASGETTVAFSTEHADERGEPLRIPGAFLINIPVFRGDDRYQVCARLRYRMSGQRLVWSYSLSKTDAIFEDAFTRAAQQAQTDTGLPLFFGLPEATP